MPHKMKKNLILIDMTALAKSVDKNRKMVNWKFEELKNLLKKAILYVK